MDRDLHAQGYPYGRPLTPSTVQTLAASDHGPMTSSSARNYSSLVH